LRVALENVVDLRELSVSRDFESRDRLIGAAGEGELESGRVVCLRLSERSDQDARIESVGGKEELGRKVFPCLGHVS
jgi:hypothetical protein